MLVALMLLGLVVAVYGPVKDQEFLDYDDPLHVTDNAAVQRGLTGENLVRAFTTSTSSIWMPVTFLSHAFDCQMYGLNPAGHKATNLAFHAVNTILLFWVLYSMTGSLWGSAFVAALFGIHPLNVESAAWVSERKNLTSTFFFLLTLGAYTHYVRGPRLGRYLVVLTLFVLSLMSKPMLVTLPFLLLLLDYWPLERHRRAASAALSSRGPSLDRPGTTLFIRDKIPMLAIVIATCIQAIRTQHADAAIAQLDALPLSVRALNATLSYVGYLGKGIAPVDLAIFYPYPLDGISVGASVASGLLLLAVSGLTAIFARRLPYLFVGWFWYLGTLVPVIGLVQIGSQSMADRYAYVPLIGVFLAFAWGAAAAGRRLRVPAAALAGAAIVVLASLAIGTRLQLDHWRDSMAIWTHTLRVTGDFNPIAHYSLARLTYERGRKDEALGHFRRAIAQAPRLAEAHFNFGVALQREGDLDGARERFLEAVSLRPSYLKARNNLGVVLLQQGRLDEAAVHFLAALGIDPRYTAAHANLGKIFAARGELGKSLDHYEQALRGSPPPDAAREGTIRGEIGEVRRRQALRDVRGIDR